MRKLTRSRSFMLTAFALAVLGAEGCAVSGETPIEYAIHRYRDLTSCVDGGISITTTPQVGLYWNSLDLLTVGYCDLDGYFLGVGGGQVGLTRLYAHCWALGYGEEQIGWGWHNLGRDRSEWELMKRRSNMIGTATALTGIDFTGNDCWTNPWYTPSCVHFVPHIGYVGLVWNARYTEFADFALGWVGLDISGDDGYNVGKWSFPRRKEELSRQAGGVRAPTPPVAAAPPAAAASAAPVQARAPQPAPPAVQRPENPPVIAPVPAAAPAGLRTYLVQPGDGLMRIAREQLNDESKWLAIAELNHLQPPYRIQIGQKLLLPE